MISQIASCTIATALIDRLHNEAAEAAPQEACGLLLGTPGAILRLEPSRNVAAHPERSFEIDPTALLRWHREARSLGLHIVGYYHSHPNGQDQPSKTDAARAVQDGMVWLIVTDKHVTAWHADENGLLYGRFASVNLIETMG